jgi:hypothetical protein
MLVVGSGAGQVFAGMMPGSDSHALLDHAPYPRPVLRTRSDQGQSRAGRRLALPPDGRQHPGDVMNKTIARPFWAG